MRLDRTRPLILALLLVAVLALVPPVLLLGQAAMAPFTERMVPEVDGKAETVGRDLAASIERAIGHGIPLDRLYGVDAFLAPVLAANREIRYLAITDAVGRMLFQVGGGDVDLAPHYLAADPGDAAILRRVVIDDFVDLALPLSGREGVAGHLHVGRDREFVRGRLQEIAYDIGVVTLVALVVAIEILLFAVGFGVIGPLRSLEAVLIRVGRGEFTHVCGDQSGDEVGRFVQSCNAAIRRLDTLYRRLESYIDEVRQAHFDRDVVARVADIDSRVRFLYRFSPTGEPVPLVVPRPGDIRLPLFLFVFAEELSRSFMPLYIGTLPNPFPALTPEMTAALPIALFLGMVALVSPSAAAMAVRIGSRRLFLAGLVPALFGLVMSALARDLVDFMLWRAATAFGYAMVTMACQVHVAQTSQDHRRAQGMGVYVGGVLTAAICGIGFGGVLAERVGYRPTFLVAAVLALVAGTMVYRLMSPKAAADEAIAPPASPRWNGARLIRNWRFSVLILFAAVPSKIALAGMFFFLCPLVLIRMPDVDLGDLARTMMLYPVAVVALSPLASVLADRMGWKAGLVAAGGLIGGGALLVPLWVDGWDGIAIAIGLLGVSHGLSAVPQLALASDVCWIECRAMGRETVLGFLRLAERIGGVAGPLLAAALVPSLGLTGAVVGLGWVVLGLATVFAVLSVRFGAGPHLSSEVEP